jgi:hypothetical protein
VTITAMTVRVLLRSRALVAAVATLVCGLGAGLAVRLLAGSDTDVAATVADLLLSPVVPAGTLFIVLAGWGAEVSTRAVVPLLLTAVPTGRLVLEKVAVLAIGAALVGALTTTGFWVVTGAPGSTWPSWAAAGALCGFVAACLATALVVLTTQAVIAYLALLIGLELLGSLLPPWAGYLNPIHWARVMTESGASTPSPAVAVGLAILTAALAVVVTSAGLWRLKLRLDG